MFGFFEKKKGDGQDGLHCANVPPPQKPLDQSNMGDVYDAVGLFEEEPKPELPKEYFQVDLKVKTTDREFGWSCPMTKDDIPSHYDEFIKWYHTQKTMMFVQTHKTGTTCFKRRDVIWYTITKRPENSTEKFNRMQDEKSDK
jgi:hypothetical protein